MHQLVAVLIADLDFEAWHDLTERAGADGAGAVGNEDVPHLGRPESVQQLDAERVVPSLVQSDR